MSGEHYVHKSLSNDATDPRRDRRRTEVVWGTLRKRVSEAPRVAPKGNDVMEYPDECRDARTRCEM